MPRLEDSPSYKYAVELAKVGPHTWKSWVDALAALATGAKELMKDAPAGSVLRSLGVKMPPKSTRSEDDIKNYILDYGIPGARVGALFAGKRSATMNRGMWAKAKKLENNTPPLDNEQIRQQTQWFRGKFDPAWRYEIPDNEAVLTPNAKYIIGELQAGVDMHDKYVKKLYSLYEQYAPQDMKKPDFLDNPYKLLPKLTNTEISDLRLLLLGKRAQEGKWTLKDVLDHPMLYDAYPEMANYKVRLTGGGGGAFSHMARSVALGADATHDSMLSVLLHEVQHGIQTIEGFPMGGAPSQFTSWLPEDIDRLENFADQATVAAALKRKAKNTNTPIHDMIRDTIRDSALPPFSTDVEDLLFDANVTADDIEKAARKYRRTMKRAQDSLDAANARYHNLAGEEEARLVERRKRLTPFERNYNAPASQLPATAEIVY